MQIRVLARFLLIVILLGGCAKSIEVRPGVYMSNNPADFSLPTSGYTVYFVGETHGNRESKLFFRTYLEKLYKEAGLRNVVLEEDQAYEADANAYVQGISTALPDGLCLRTDILGQIRDFNSKLPDAEKVTVHLVDVDSPFAIAYNHLAELSKKIEQSGKVTQIPNLPEFQSWSSAQRFGLIKDLETVAVDQPDIVNGLDTVYWSLRWSMLNNEMDTGQPTGFRKNFAPIREDVITKNIEYLLSQLNGRPILAFFGASHGMKAQADPNPPVDGFKSWAQRLVEKNVKVYSLATFGISGSSFWRGETLTNDGNSLQGFNLMDGTPVISLFDTHSDASIIYTDLKAGDNTTIKLSKDLVDIPASQIYDGVIVFKEFTPMENTCPQ